MMSSKRPLEYLALGDSYTIGEAVQTSENFPNQLCQLLKEKGIGILPPRIIAKTGWTTDELINAITEAGREKPLPENYDIVTLLIGVNNQYRGRPLKEYEQEFTTLLKKAIVFAGDQPQHVIVLSIPDWGVTPFAEGQNREEIARSIDSFNRVNLAASRMFNAQYLDITPLTREAGTNNSLIAQDGLHPSGADYKRWATLLAAKAFDLFNN
jgi:lysophospholipase L1-like esterase